jgi:hypothetical protein
MAAGALVGVAALAKITALAWIPAPALVTWFRERSWPAGVSALLAAAAGAAAVIGLTLGWLAWRGSADEAVYWVLLHNVAYVTAPIGAREAFIRAARGSGTWALCTAPVWLAAWAHRPSRASDPARALFAWVLLILAAPAVFLGFRFFGHYYIQVLYPLCLAAGPVTARLATRQLTLSARAALIWMLLVFGITAAGNAWLFSRTDVIESTRPIFANVAARMRADACFQGGTLFVWGVAPMFYVETGLQPASRFVLPQESISGYVPGRSADATAHRLFSNTGGDWDKLFADLEESQATYILDTAPSGLHFWSRYPLGRFPTLEAYIRRHYEQIAVVDRVVIYRRHGCAARLADGGG